MKIAPLQHPTMALSISEDALFITEVKHSWRTTTLRDVKKVALPPGTLRLSSAKLNIENMEVFKQHLGLAVASLQKPVSIALSLPDLCARTSLFEFSTFPGKKSEQLALLNWRFQQDLKLDTVQSRLDYEVYVPTSLADASTKSGNPEKVRVLGTAIRNEIVEQYERACLELKLIPISVGISGLDIFDLYQPTIKEILEVEDRRTSNTSPEAMFIFISHWGFTFFAFNEGCPSFVRTKAITIRPNSSLGRKDASPSGSANDEHPAPKVRIDLPTLYHEEVPGNEDYSTHPYPFYTVIKVEKEILATLQYYLETYLQDGSLPSLANLFVVSDLEYGQSLLPAPEHLQQTAKVSGLSISDIQVTLLSSVSQFNKRESSVMHDSNIWSALPGYASLMVA
ncbi:MAG: hypothetical protein WD032_02415 [Nitrospirales bacterium]